MRTSSQITTSLVIVLGSALVTAQAASAQQPTGQVLGIEADGDGCAVTLVTGIDQLLNGRVDSDTCTQLSAGSEIQFTPALTQVEVLPSPTVATVTELVAGDRACYVNLVDANDKTTTQFANFDICEQDLVGAQVRLTYETGNIIAFSCEGDIECGRSDRAILISQAEVISRPTPTAQPTVGSLPDGNYRYWSGSSNNAVVSDQELLANGGVTFLFSKRGNNVTGLFGYVDGEAICVQGQVNDNAVTGISVQNLRGANVISSGETFSNFGPSDRLQVRRGRQINRETVRYNSTLLNLAGMNRINAGSVLPPGRC